MTGIKAKKEENGTRSITKNIKRLCTKHIISYVKSVEKNFNPHRLIASFVAINVNRDTGEKAG